MGEYPLVEPEGVNAGSAEEVAEDRPPAPPEATRDGGDPAGPDDAPDGGSEWVGAPEPQEESGQDEGSL
jgi:hypothetical protein